MRRLPNVREIVAAVQEAVSASTAEKRAAAEVHMSSDIAADMQKLANEVSSGIISVTSYNEVMKFVSELKQAVQR